MLTAVVQNSYNPFREPGGGSHLFCLILEQCQGRHLRKFVLEHTLKEKFFRWKMWGGDCSTARPMREAPEVWFQWNDRRIDTFTLGVVSLFFRQSFSFSYLSQSLSRKDLGTSGMKQCLKKRKRVGLRVRESGSKWVTLGKLLPLQEFASLFVQKD